MKELKRRTLRNAFFCNQTRELLGKSADLCLQHGIESAFEVFYSGTGKLPFYHTELRIGDEDSVPWVNYRGLIHIIAAHSHPEDTSSWGISLADLQNAAMMSNKTADQLRGSRIWYERAIRDNRDPGRDPWQHEMMTYPVEALIQPLDEKRSDLYLYQLCGPISRNFADEEGVTERNLREYMKGLEPSGLLKVHFAEYDRKGSNGKRVYRKIMEALEDFSSTEVDFDSEHDPYGFMDSFPIIRI